MKNSAITTTWLKTENAGCYWTLMVQGERLKWLGLQRGK